MDSKEMLKYVEPFYEMILATLILSNNSSMSWKRDSTKLIDFICESYDLTHLASDYKEMILNTINNLSLVSEYKGLRGEHNFNDEYSEIEIAYNMKGQALLQLKKADKFSLHVNGEDFEVEMNNIEYSKVNNAWKIFFFDETADEVLPESIRVGQYSAVRFTYGAVMTYLDGTPNTPVNDGIERFKETSRAAKLKMSVSPFVLRRLKTDKNVISDLPEKMVMNDYCYLAKSQAILYEKTLNEMMEKISGFTGVNRRGNIFNSSLRSFYNFSIQR